MTSQPDLPMASEKLLTKKQLAEKLCVTQRTVDRWLADEILPADVKVIVGDRTVRFRETIANKWIAAGCPGAVQ